MKQLYSLIIIFLLVIAGNSAFAQLHHSAASRYQIGKEHFTTGDGVIDPRSDVRLFPNPAVEYLVVEINSPQLNKVSFELNNIIGNAIHIKSEALGENKYKIYVKDLRPGYYFLTINDDNSNYKRTYRFLKK